MERETESNAIREIGSRRELFVDNYLIDQMNDVSLRLHHPRPAEPAITFGKGEAGFGGYSTVLKDGDVYRMYYRGVWGGGEGSSDHTEITLYAESRHGVNWNKPDLGLYDIPNLSPNNTVIPNDPHLQTAHNFIPFLDTRPGIPASERYKALAGSFVGIDTKDARNGFNAFVSADGVRWKMLTEEFVINPAHFGVHTDHSSVPAFWSDSEDCYVAYLRIRVDENLQPLTSHDGRSIRWIGRTTSNDFLNWSEVVPMNPGDAPLEQLYTNQTQPYFRAPHIYLAFPKRFNHNLVVLPEDEFDRYEVSTGQRQGVSEGVFMTSRGGTNFDRTFMEAFLPPGLDRQNWVARNNMAACGIVPTAPEEISIYYLQHNSQPTSHLRRHTLRTDGFVSVKAPYRGGELVTKPLIFNGKALEINFATSIVGNIRIEIQDIGGQPIPDFKLADANEIVGDEIARDASWKGVHGSDVSQLAGQLVRLRFVMKDADLYAIRFRP